jgi:hypothetical protein
MDMCMETSLTPAQLKGYEPMPTHLRVESRNISSASLLSDLTWSSKLPTQMYRLNKWCMELTKQGWSMLISKIRQQHYFRGEDEINIEFEEIYQLYHLNDLDKSLISCWCLSVIYFYN